MNRPSANIVAGWSLSWLVLALLLLAATVSVAQQPASSAPATQTLAPSKTAPAAKDVNAHASEKLIDASIPDDNGVDKMLDVYSPKVRALDVIIGALKGELKKGGMGAGSLGNFVADGMRSQGSLKLGKPIDVAIMNGGGLRRTAIGEGELRARDIFELLPFENALVTLDLTGEQVLKLLGVVVSSREAQSGARLTYINKADKTSALETATLLDGKQIDPHATYAVVTIDYLINVGGDRYAVLREGKNTRPLGITLRDALMNYVKAETAAGRDIKPNLDGRFYLDRAGSAPGTEAPPK